MSIPVYQPRIRVLLDTMTRNERGASAVEYGLLVVGIPLIAWLSIKLFGLTVFGVFDAIATVYSNG